MPRLACTCTTVRNLASFAFPATRFLQSFTRWKSLRHIIERLPEAENEAFRTVGSTIGGMIVFPANIVDGKQTINGARGFTRQIADRMDLTLECIRRHYLGQSSPLVETLLRYDDFFTLFENFRGYVDFFLLQDMVINDYSRVKFFLPFDNFTTPAVPKDVESYMEFRRQSIDFTKTRHRRIKQYTLQNAGATATPA